VKDTQETVIVDLDKRNRAGSWNREDDEAVELMFAQQLIAWGT
jgi:hypothetical protein